MGYLCFIEVKIKYTYIIFLQINEKYMFFLQLVNNEKIDSRCCMSTVIQWYTVARATLCRK